MNATVGRANADILGDSNEAIQRAVDDVAAAGGGTVTLLPGIYTMRNRIEMRSGTVLVGSGEDTVLAKADGWEEPLWEDGDWGNDWATCDPLPPVRVGDGVHLWSSRDFGWNTTTATVVEVDGNRIRVSRPFNGNHMVQDGARIASAHSIIEIETAENIAVSNLAIEGNAERNARLDGCRGGAIHGLFSKSVRISAVEIRNFNGDAISFQRSDDWVIEDCRTEGNTGHGLHPGSGSQRPVIRGCTSRGNGRCGIFVCWRVKFGVFEGNLFEGNVEAGISIGHKDTDNVFRRNRIIGNKGPGILVRNEKAPMCPDRCLYEGNVIEGNSGGGPQVVVKGEVSDLVFRGNIYDRGAPRFQIAEGVRNLVREQE